MAGLERGRLKSVNRERLSSCSWIKQPREGECEIAQTENRGKREKRRQMKAASQGLREKMLQRQEQQQRRQNLPTCLFRLQG